MTEVDILAKWSQLQQENDWTGARTLLLSVLSSHPATHTDEGDEGKFKKRKTTAEPTECSQEIPCSATAGNVKLALPTESPTETATVTHTSTTAEKQDPQQQEVKSKQGETGKKQKKKNDDVTLFVEGDVVWAALGKLPHWPTVVVQQGGKQRNGQSQVKLFSPPEGREGTQWVKNTNLQFFDKIPAAEMEQEIAKRIQIEQYPHAVAYAPQYNAAVHEANEVANLVLSPEKLPSTSMKPIGIVYSPYRAHYMAPRQPHTGGVDASHGWIQLRKGMENGAKDLIGFERLWIVFEFSFSKGGSLTVVPPRDGKRKIGVLATRSPHRPNPIGLSCVQLCNVVGRKILIKDHDLLHGTPVLDIKPYIAYCDAHPNVKQGWLEDLPKESTSTHKNDHRWDGKQYTLKTKP
eukprot:TRINITY_DN21071_c0_g1_i1.p1 TRINITY_DN21071_c0_g1~~TRINITY_DN21071_c0_g1_i1.p1  ORF type:complete len:406 (-),score=40.44 TRINITY_DN21071_c0_g1_i1:97-1314(-)